MNVISAGLGFEGWFGIVIVAICIITLVVSGRKDIKDIPKQVRDKRKKDGH